ncbi:2OG-Fe(II) oxygenase [Taibaiella soli]|uniref:2OG-Fe(II) oxygenase n=1 Tax=Taibaiella soli TaxID=1649169 RepID=A0A2W2C0A7_9BACT|nr:2OG-Fe(II) oxygenase [Taibaiella soli]PZF73503.1 2OG-Fe(II) oxygenase [Taibaiella soli]
MAIYKPFRQVQNIKRKDYNTDLVDYVWLTNYFTPEEVQKIRAIWDDAKAIESKVNKSGSEIDREDLRRSRIMFIDGPEHEWIYSKLATACIQINTNRFKFDVTGFQTALQLASYGPDDFFEWHMDYGAGDISNRKLSITVQLSDENEYEGGDLQFMINHNAVSAPKTQGTAVIFPSYAQHRVLPVTKGNRLSIVGWIGGPPYR